jgi:MoxR-like ATPase
VELKQALLLKAFHEGAVVVIDELNAAPIMERLLNSLLMGETITGDRPKNPGFMVIGTQNPSTMAGRYEASTAIKRRLMHVNLPDYTNSDMRFILEAKGIPRVDAINMIKCFNKAKEKAHDNSQLIEPTFRELERLADDYIAKVTLKNPWYAHLPEKVITRSASFSNIKDLTSHASFFPKESQRPVERSKPAFTLNKGV